MTGTSGIGILRTMNKPNPTVAELKARLEAANAEEFSVLERALRADTRKGIVRALDAARKRIGSQEAERRRLESLYMFEQELSHGKLIVGLDEVGRGPLAGPLAVGAVVLARDLLIEGLDDSKKVKPADRKTIAACIREQAQAWAVVYIEPEAIDAAGMTASLRVAFSRAVRAIEEQGIIPETILLDGNALHFDPRELNVVKGDGRCASIAAASIVAKVARDELMEEYAKQYPEYGFEGNKGYGSPSHLEALGRYGLSPIHRRSFCSAFLQESLF